MRTEWSDDVLAVQDDVDNMTMKVFSKLSVSSCLLMSDLWLFILCTIRNFLRCRCWWWTCQKLH